MLFLLFVLLIAVSVLGYYLKMENSSRPHKEKTKRAAKKRDAKEVQKAYLEDFSLDEQKSKTEVKNIEVEKAKTPQKNHNKQDKTL